MSIIFRIRHGDGWLNILQVDRFKFPILHSARLFRVIQMSKIVCRQWGNASLSLFWVASYTNGYVIRHERCTCVNEEQCSFKKTCHCFPVKYFNCFCATPNVVCRARPVAILYYVCYKRIGVIFYVCSRLRVFALVSIFRGEFLVNLAILFVSSICISANYVQWSLTVCMCSSSVNYACSCLPRRYLSISEWFPICTLES